MALQRSKNPAKPYKLVEHCFEFNFSNKRLCLSLKPRNSQHRGENDRGLRHIVWKVLEEEHDKEEHVLMGVL